MPGESTVKTPMKRPAAANEGDSKSDAETAESAAQKASKQVRCQASKSDAKNAKEASKNFESGQLMQPMSQLGSKPSKTTAFARILAETVERLNVTTIQVRTSQNIGGEFRDRCDGHFEHTPCYSTQQGRSGRR